jgi:hypothetical protein
MRRCAIALLLGLLLSACMRGERPRTHAAWEREATRVWEKETKARVIAAAEIVLKQSDPRDFLFEYNGNGFVARRRFHLFAVLATASGEDRWNFSAAGNEEGASAAIRIIQRGTARAGNATERFRDNQTFVGTFRLFYARIDYMLGRRKDWVTCDAAPAVFGLDTREPGTDGLCSITHDGKTAPAPPPLPKIVAVTLPPQRKGPPPPPFVSEATEGEE